MHFLELIFLIPIAAIVFGAGGEMVKNILKSQEKRLQLRLRAQRGQDEAVTRQLQELRTEIAALRDTTTQYDLTNDHIVQGMEGRLSRLETRLAAKTATTSTEDQPAQLNRR